MKDIEKKAAEIIAGMSTKDLSREKNKILDFLNTPEGKKLSSSLGGESSSVAETIKNMSAEDIAKKLRQADLSKLSGKNIDEILKKLR